LGFGELSVDYDGERTFTIKATMEDKVKILGSFKVPVQIYQGVWKEGTQYSRGDTVSFGGSSWVAKCDTDGKPEISRDWQLATKRGRDGKDGKPGADGRDGKDGKSSVAFPPS